jgi:hypothetical protein
MRFPIATIVLVHGIAQEQKAADTLENEWLPALAGGVRLAGYPEIADCLWRDRSIDVRMAFYGSQFLKRDQQGDASGDLEDAEEALAERLAMEWLERAAEQASRSQEKATAVRELAYVRSEVGAEEAGSGAVLRSAINGLARVRWFAPYGFAFAARFVAKSLAQMTRYLSDEEIRSAAQQAVLDQIGPETKIVISHSLGSVVAYEAVQRLNRPLPLLITLGSPLGLDTLIYPKLRPQPPIFPPGLNRWVNIAGRDDFIAAAPDLTSLFSTGIPEDAIFEGGWTVDTGAQPHCAEFYLTKVEVGRPVRETLSA